MRAWTSVMRGAAMLLALVVMLAPGRARAEDYIIGAEDVLAVSVYLHPELERSATVDANGSVTFPPVGEVKAAGLTPRQLGDRIGDKLTTYLRQTTQVTVTVTGFLSRSVYVTGAVAKPGRFGFERMPTLPDAIAQAGGAAVGSDLSRVQVIRNDGTTRKTIYADVARVLRDGVTSDLPELKPGDTIVVPQGMGAAAYAGQGVGGSVIGEVARPGIYPVGNGQDLWTLLAGAGGVTSNSDLKKVRILSRQGDGYNAVQLNLKDILDHGSPTAVVVRDGDLVYIPSLRTSNLARGTIAIVAILNATESAFNILVLNQVYQDGRTPK